MMLLFFVLLFPAASLIPLPAGTPVKMLLNEPLNTGLVSEGQIVMCKSYGGVMVQGTTVITHGAPGHARVVEVRTARKKKITSISVEAIDITACDGQVVALNGTLAEIVVNEEANGIGHLLAANVAGSMDISLSKGGN
jgi:hypothetical protein